MKVRSLVVALVLGIMQPGEGNAAAGKLIKSTVKVDGKTYKCQMLPGAKKWTVAVEKAGAKSVCSSLNKNKASKLKSLASIPDASELTKAAANTSSAHFLPAVSGTAPTLLSIAQGSVQPENVFFSDNTIAAVIGNSASANQCNSFWGGTSDGASGGFGACYMTQGVGYSFQNILQGGTSMCYMKNAPTEANVSAGGVTVISGSLPGGDITKVFSPGSSTRMVKVQVQDPDFGNSDGFIKVFSSGSNASKGLAYAADLYFCNGGSPDGLEKIRIKLSGEAENSSLNSNGGGVSSSKITAFLKKVGDEYQWDLTKDRTATVEFSGNEVSFKSKLILTPQNIIKNWQYDVFGDQQRKSYSVSEISGESISDLRFLQGAYKEEGGQGGTYQTSVEYRDSFYAAAPSGELVDDLSDVDIGSDSFFNSSANPQVDLSGLDCNADADIELGMDMSNPAMSAVQEECEGERLDGMDFCSQDTQMQQAMNNFGTACGSF